MSTIAARLREVAKSRKAYEIGDTPWPSNMSSEDLDKAASEIERLDFDLREALKAVLHFYGPDGAEKVTRHVMEAQWERDNAKRMQPMAGVSARAYGELAEEK